MALLETTQHFASQLKILNEHVTPQAAPFLLTRIISKLDQKNARPFSNVEEQKLCVKLSLEEKQLQDILETSGYIFEQAAYYGGSSEALGKELAAAGLNGELVSAFGSVWDNNGAELRAKLSERSICAKSLQSSDWSMGLHMGQDDMSRIKQSTATVSLTVMDQDHDNEVKTHCLEFSHAELIQFSKYMDRIQDQLDSLG